METKPTSQNEQQANRRYLTVWRWHFYAGLLVAPFLTLLAVTGLGMLLFANVTGKEGERIHVTPQAQVQPLSAQAEAARQFVNPETASVVQYIAPRADDMVAVFRVNNDDKAAMVAVDPYTAKVVNSTPRNDGWYHIMDENPWRYDDRHGGRLYTGNSRFTDYFDDHYRDLPVVGKTARYEIHACTESR